jgi:hypothetical protein
MQVRLGRAREKIVILAGNMRIALSAAINSSLITPAQNDGKAASDSILLAPRRATNLAAEPVPKVSTMGHPFRQLRAQPDHSMTQALISKVDAGD